MTNEIRLRVVRVPDDTNEEGTVPFGDNEGWLSKDFEEGIVVMLGNDCAPDHCTIFAEGDVMFFDREGQFTPRCEDWADIRVHVLIDRQISC